MNNSKSASRSSLNHSATNILAQPLAVGHSALDNDHLNQLDQLISQEEEHTGKKVFKRG